MESVIERAIFLAIGGGIGFILGYIVARLREIKEEVDEVLDIEKHNARTRDERGFMRFPVVADVMLVLVLIIVVWGAFSAQKASNDVADQQKRLAQVTACNQEFLAKTIIALNERTTFTVEQTKANVAVQQAQADFFLGIYEEPLNDELELKLFKEYVAALEEFVEVSGDNVDKSEDFPYATPEELKACLERDN